MEEIQAAKRNAQEQLRLLEMQERNLQMGASKEELETISSRLHRSSLTGPVSEPTTPPEYNDGVYSNRFSRSSRMSNNSIMSPPGLGKRSSGTSSIMSPGTTRLSGSMYNQAQKPSAKSVPGSRRGSDEEEDYAEELPNIRNTARYVVPVIVPMLSHFTWHSAQVTWDLTCEAFTSILAIHFTSRPVASFSYENKSFLSTLLPPHHLYTRTLD